MKWLYLVPGQMAGFEIQLRDKGLALKHQHLTISSRLEIQQRPLSHPVGERKYSGTYTLHPFERFLLH